MTASYFRTFDRIK